MQIEGRNTVIETLRAKKQIKVIYIEKDINIDEKISKIRKLASKQGIEVRYKPKKFLNKISQTKSHQGVIALKAKEVDIGFKHYLDKLIEDGTQPFFIYVREALYEHNLGAVIRTAEAAGLDGVVIPPKTRLTAQTVRAATGATEHIPVIKEGLFNSIKFSRQQGLKIVGIEVSGKNDYFDEDLTGPLLLIIGGEDRPLSEAIIKKTDTIVRIPQKGKVNSLNMSVAAAIVIYDKIRQESLTG
ncbi:MAG: 23S rRNA (guanosine(2251)-2'-O)-methyltransferase RlmB [Candidatus Dojkabacteria bacterium]